MRDLFKSTLSRVHSSYYERLTGLAISRERFSDIYSVPLFQKRDLLWQQAFDIHRDKAVTVLEFGVFKGKSINRFAKLNTNEDSRFFGFDSFEGLPEDWTRHQRRSAFDVGGQLPFRSDDRISFVPGWFQNTLPPFLDQHPIENELIVHYDADLFSATLFVLLQIDRLKKPYIAIFDEFFGHEPRALWRYMQIQGCEVEFIGRAGDRRFPTQVACWIKPAVHYAPKH